MASYVSAFVRGVGAVLAAPANLVAAAQAATASSVDTSAQRTLQGQSPGVPGSLPAVSLPGSATDAAAAPFSHGEPSRPIYAVAERAEVRADAELIRWRFVRKQSEWCEGEVISSEETFALTNQDFKAAFGDNFNDVLRKLSCSSYSLTDLVALDASGKTVGVQLTSDELQKLRSLYDQKVRKPTTWPQVDLDAKGRGNKAGPVCLVADTDRTKKHQKITADEFVDFLQIQWPTDAAKKTERVKQIQRTEKWIDEFIAKLDEMLAAKRAETGGDAQKREQEISELEKLKTKWENCDRFAIYYAIATEQEGEIKIEDLAKKAKESIESLSTFFDPHKTHGKVRSVARKVLGTATAIVSKLPKVNVQYPGDLTDSEKRYIHDVVMLGTRDHAEYTQLCGALGFPSKQDPIEWAIVRMARGEGDEGVSKKRLAMNDALFQELKVIQTQVAQQVP